VKDIIDQCINTIPATHVDRVFYYYQTYIDPTLKNKPCTCSPRSWTGFVHTLRDKVTDVLTEAENTPSDIGEF
jgi:hypothetical protein